MEIGNSAREEVTAAIELNKIKCGSFWIRVNWITMRHSHDTVLRWVTKVKCSWRKEVRGVVTEIIIIRRHSIEQWELKLEQELPFDELRVTIEHAEISIPSTQWRRRACLLATYGHKFNPGNSRISGQITLILVSSTSLGHPLEESPLQIQLTHPQAIEDRFSHAPEVMSSSCMWFNKNKWKMCDPNLSPQSENNETYENISPDCN